MSNWPLIQDILISFSVAWKMCQHTSHVQARPELSWTPHSSLRGIAQSRKTRKVDQRRRPERKARCIPVILAAALQREGRARK